MERREGFVEVDGGRLRYEVAGDGDPIVFLHGFGLDARMWDGEVEHFRRDYTVVRYDLRGFGRSSLPAAPFAHHDDLAALLAHLGLDGAHVVGLSMGGGVAVDFALAHPSRVRSLVLVDSIVGGFSWQKNATEMRAAWAAGKSGGIEAGRAAWLASPLFAPSLRQPDVAARVQAMVADYSGWHFVHDSPQRPLQPPALQRLDTIAARTLVVVGALDLPDFRAIAERLAGAIPGARQLVLDGVGHLASMEAPAQFHAALADFLAET
jgi:pimeloyl-ACP methyl ester carboxylesterase